MTGTNHGKLAAASVAAYLAARNHGESHRDGLHVASIAAERCAIKIADRRTGRPMPERAGECVCVG
jgi:hypothetical protein